MKNWLIVLLISFGIVACGGGGGGGSTSATPTAEAEEDTGNDSEDNGGNSGSGSTPTVFISPDYNIESEKTVSYSYSSSGGDCDLVIYKVPYQENGSYIEDTSDILEELDQVENCEITNRTISVLSTTTELCVSKNNAQCESIIL